MASPQTGIFALGTSSHAYLEFDLSDAADAQADGRARGRASGAANHDRWRQPRRRVPAGALGSGGPRHSAGRRHGVRRAGGRGRVDTRFPQHSTTS